MTRSFATVYSACTSDGETSALDSMDQQTKPGVLRARSVPVRYRCMLLLCAACGGAFLLLSVNNRSDLLFVHPRSWHPSSRALTHHYDLLEDHNGFTIKTEGCTIPGLQPFDDKIKKFVKPPTNLESCRYANISLLDNNDTHIWIQHENIGFYRILSSVNVSCCYRPFFRPSAIADISSASVDDRVQYEDCVQFSNYMEVMHEFVKVSCGYDYNIVYEQYFIFAPKKQMMTYTDDSIETSPNESSYNVIVMGIDAISRLNFYRTMPKTLAYLKKKGAVELLGYNKVGDNTFPNLTPMLLGIREQDLKRTCWPNMKARFDNCPFIWEWFREAGYYTALAEDSASLGTFNYKKYGFSGAPTDYYTRTFIREAEIHVANNKDFNSFICMGNKYFYQVLLDYIESLTSTLKSDRLFGFFWEVTMSHDYLNYPMVMDESYEKFLKRLDSSKYLDETILILLSDHGMRWGGIRYTKQGRLEERLPLVHILLPQSFKENYSLAYNNLKLNSRRLTTPFDIHATLSDLVSLETIKNEKIKSRTKIEYARDRSISLFLPIPGNRTCKTAGIVDHWCTCHSSSKLPLKSGEAREAAMFVIRHLNGLLKEHAQCASLKLAEVVEAMEMVVGTPDEKEVGWREFMIVARAEPGGGVFEATVRRDSRDWALLGSVSRLNLYGEQSHCVNNYQLKLYCFCQ